MIFKIGDHVVDIHESNTLGIIRAKYKRQYLVEFPENEKWCRFGCFTSSELLLEGTPLAEQFKEKNEKMRKLEREADEIYEEIKQILKQKG